MKFVFILTMYLNTGPEIVLVQSDLTGPQCINAMQQAIQLDPKMDKGTPSCEYQTDELLDVQGQLPFPLKGN